MRTASRSTSLHHCDRFVARTMNWLYDHLRHLDDRYPPWVLCRRLEHRDEFPEIEAVEVDPSALRRRVWRRVANGAPFSPDLRAARRRSPALWHSHFGHVAVETHQWLERLELPRLVSFYGADLYALATRPEWQRRYRSLFERAEAILALGPAMARRLEGLGAEPAKVRVHPLGVDVHALPTAYRSVRPGGPLKLLFAGTFREKKGIEYVIEGAALASRRGVPIELHLAGDTHGKPGDRDTKERVFRRIRRLGLEDVVTHHSWLAYRELVSLALECHVLVHPSVTASDGDAEGTPFVIQQMMATGMPVVATRHSDIPFLFGEYADLLVPERDGPAIADELVRYWEEPERVATVGRALRRTVVERLDVRDRARELADLYDVVTGRETDLGSAAAAEGA